MAETLVELVAIISADATKLKADLKSAEGDTEKTAQLMAKSLKKVGQAMAASGAAITAAMGLMGKAAIDEEINIKRLATTMGNVGVSYDKVKDSLEAVISATQRKTGVADDEQRNILNRLILVTNDYNKALELLPTVLDLAAAGEMDATTAATYLGKAFLELEDGADEVSVRFGQASLQFKSMEDIQNRVRGAAENLVNPLSVLKATMGDVAEAIGINLLPFVKELTDKIVDIAITVQAWTQEHPLLAKVITLVVASLGALLTVVGGLILILPTLIAGVAAFGVVFHVALGPIGLISLAITGLIALGVLLWANWAWISEKATEIWGGITDFFKDTWGKITGFFKEHWDKILAILFPAVGIPILIMREWDGIKRFLQNLNPWEWIKEGWEKLSGGIKNVLHGLFGGSIIEDWVSGVKGFFNSQDLGPQGTKMFGSLRDAIAAQLDRSLNDINGYAREIPSALMGVWQAGAKAQEAGKEVYTATTFDYLSREEKQAAIDRGATIIPHLAQGGIITQPTVALLGEAGPEMVTPLSDTRVGGIVINFTQPVFFDREDSMNKFVDMIRRGIQRQDRLRFGGAYSG